jgi:hypothetical protein
MMMMRYALVASDAPAIAGYLPGNYPSWGRLTARR